MDKMTAICLIIFILVILSNFFRYKPKQGGVLYSSIVASRGLHVFYPENSITAFKYAVKAHLAISIDVRITKDGKLVCFHDRYTKRLLGIPGKVSLLNYDKLRKFNLCNTKEKVPLLSMALANIKGKVPVLLNLRGRVTKEYLAELYRVLEKYDAKVYFETKSLSVYNILKTKYTSDGEKLVYFVLNPFRKRPQCIKDKDYDFQRDKYYEMFKTRRTSLPTIEDISSVLVRNMEELENKKEILASIGKTINRYETRIGNKHWVRNSIWLHRSIVSNKYPEYSRESFEECLKFADKHNVNLTLEFDVMLYEGEVKCYHKDRISSILGQDVSCAEKLNIEETLSLSEILDTVKDNPKINLAIDIKDFHFKNRELERLIIKNLENSNFKGNFILMSFNPMVLNYFKKVRPDWLRAQVGHSLKGLREKVPFFRFPWVINGLLGMLFDLSDADCVVMDNSNWLYYLISFHRNVQGKPVLIYAPKSYKEQEAFVGRDSVANFIVENIESTEDWPRSYIKQFKQ